MRWIDRTEAAAGAVWGWTTTGSGVVGRRVDRCSSAGSRGGMHTPEPPPACPARQQVVLEPTDRWRSRGPGRVSPAAPTWSWLGCWARTWCCRCGRVQPGSPSTVVGSLPTPTDKCVLVGVDDAGEPGRVRAPEGRAGHARRPPSVLHPLVREHRNGDRHRGSDGGGPPGVAYPANARAISADGRRIVWTQSFRRVGPEPHIRHRMVTVTGAGTDAVIAGGVTGVGADRQSWVSSGGRQTLDFRTMVSLDTGQRTDLGPDIAAASAAFRAGTPEWPPSATTGAPRPAGRRPVREPACSRRSSGIVRPAPG